MPHRGETEEERQAQRGAFEERRVQRVEALKQELVRDNLLDPHKLDNVSYYQTIEEQNQFLNSIKNTHFGSTLLRIQAKDTRDRVSMILPKFSNTRLEALTTSTIYNYTFPDITKKEERFLTAMNLGIYENMNGKSATRKNKTQAFKDIVDGTFKYSTELEWRDGKYQETEIGTGFIRGAGATRQKETTQKTGGFEILPEAVAEEISLSSRTQTILNNIESGTITVPSWFMNNVNWVKSGHITETAFIDAFNFLHLSTAQEPIKAPVETTKWYKVTRPSGIIEKEKVSQKFVNTMTPKGWKFESTIEPKPDEELRIFTPPVEPSIIETPVTTQGKESTVIVTPTEPAQLPAEALPIGFTGVIAALVVLGGLFSWRNK